MQRIYFEYLHKIWETSNARNIFQQIRTLTEILSEVAPIRRVIAYEPWVPVVTVELHKLDWVWLDIDACK